MAELEYLVETAEGAVVGLPETCVASFRKSITAPLAVKLRDANLEMRRRYPQGYLSLSISHAAEMDVRAFSDPVLRATLSSLVRQMRESNVQQVIVVEGEGFGAAALRAATTAMVMLDPSRLPPKLFGRMDQALQWIERSCVWHTPLPPRSALGATVAELRRKYRAP